MMSAHNFDQPLLNAHVAINTQLSSSFRS